MILAIAAVGTRAVIRAWRFIGASLPPSGLWGLLVSGTVLIRKAVSTIYQELNLRGQQAIINVSPGDYIESVKVSGLPAGGYSQTPLLIRKAPGQAGAVFWSLNTATMTECLEVNNGAVVSVEGIQFRVQTPGTDNRSYIRVLNHSLLMTGSCEFNLMGGPNLLNACHIIASGYSEVQLTQPYTLAGGGTNHIRLIDGSYLWTPTTQTDPKIVTVAGSAEFQEIFRLIGRSDLRLENNTIQYQGNLQGRRFRSDALSRAELGTTVLPASTIVEVYDAYTLPSTVTFNGPVTAATSFTSLGPTTLSGPTTVTNTAEFSASTNFTGTVTFQSNVIAPNPPTEENSTKVATTSFVQQVVQDKLVSGLPIATPLLFGLVKINTPSADPILYRKQEVDTLLDEKAPINNPQFTGMPQAPTPAAGDNSTNLATTAWVRNHTAGISAIPIGTILPYAGATDTIPDGWLLCDGSYVSRATYANLFAVLGTTWGTSTPSDFRLPPLVDRGLMGAADDAALGTLAGAASVSLAVNNLPAHNHNVLDPGHSHTITDPGHNHSIVDPGHVHSINDPGHVHACDNAKITQPVASPNINWQATWSGGGVGLISNITALANVTGIAINRAWTGIQVSGKVTGISINNSGTGITTQNTGSGTPVNVLNPHAKVHYIIKV